MRTLFALLVLGVCSFQLLLHVFQTPNLVDATNVWNYLNLPNNPYIHTQPTGLKYIYPPSSLIILSPLRYLSLTTFQIGLSVASIFFLVLSVLILTKNQLTLPHRLLFSAFLIQTVPTKFTIILGQINLIVVGLVCLSLYYYRISKFLSVVFFVAAAGLKLIPLYLLPLFLLRRDFKFVFLVVTLFVLLNLLPSPSLALHYYSHTLPTFSIIGLSPPPIYDVSVTALTRRLTSNTLLIKSVPPIFLLTMFSWVIYTSKHLHLYTSSALLLATLSIGNYFSWHHHLVFVFPLIIALYSRFNKHRLSRLVFMGLWLLFVFHFDYDHPPLHLNPLLESYPTLIVLVLITVSLSLFQKHLPAQTV